MINRKKITIVVTLVILIIILGFLSHYFYFSRFQPKELTHAPCLSEDEFADFDYNTDLYNTRSVKIPDKSATTIYIKDKDIGREISKFVINDVRTNADTLEIHQCGVYVIRNFDFNEKKGLYERHELWRYSYDDKGEILMDNEELYPYAKIIRIDPSESYLPLSRYYFGHPEHGIYIKNLKSPQLDDILIIKPTDIWQKSPQLDKEREVGAGVGWSRDGKYFWAGSDGKTDYAYFRVNINNKELEVFVMPEDAIHYGPPQVNIGYIWYIYGPPWVGIAEISEQVYNEWRKEGKKQILFLYNLFTKEKITLATVDDPEWDFKPKWISDTELEYELPTGEKKIYKIYD